MSIDKTLKGTACQSQKAMPCCIAGTLCGLCRKVIWAQSCKDALYTLLLVHKCRKLANIGGGAKRVTNGRRRTFRQKKGYDLGFSVFTLASLMPNNYQTNPVPVFYYKQHPLKDVLNDRETTVVFPDLWTDFLGAFYWSNIPSIEGWKLISGCPKSNSLRSYEQLHRRKFNWALQII